MIIIKTAKKISGGIELGKSWIDGQTIYKFESFEEFMKTRLKADECQVIPSLELDNDIDLDKKVKLNKMIE